MSRVSKHTSQTVAALLLSAAAWGQTRIDLGRQGRNIDFRLESSTKPSQAGTTLPTHCEPAEVFIKTDAPNGMNVHVCVEQDKWVAQSTDIVGTGGVHSICGDGTCTVNSDTGYLQWRKNDQDGVDMLVAAKSGSATAYSGCPTTNTPSGRIIEAYTAGMRPYLLPDISAGGGETTLDVCNLGPKPLKRADGISDPSPKDIVAGRLYRVWYDGVVFRLPDVSWGAISGSLADQADLQMMLNEKQSVSTKGQANGYASLGADGKVPVSQLPEGAASPLAVQVDGAPVGAGSTIHLVSAQGLTWTAESSPDNVTLRPYIEETYWAKVDMVQSGSPWVVMTTGGPSVYSGTMQPALTAEKLRPGTRLVWVVNLSCSAGPISLAIDGMGATPVRKSTNTGLSDPVAADCEAGAPVGLLYDGSVFRMEGGVSVPTWGGIIGALADQNDLQAALNAKQAALGYIPEDTGNKGQPDGYASLGPDGQVPVSQLPPFASPADLTGKQGLAEKGQPGGYASLGPDGQVPSSQLPPGGGIIPNAHYRTVPLGTSMTSVAPVSTPGQMRYIRQTVTYGLAVGAMGVRVATGVAGATGRIGVYALDSTKLLDSGDLSFATNNTSVWANVPYNLPAGEYYFVWTSNDAGVTLSGVTASVTNDLLTAHSPGTYYMGNAASTWPGAGSPLPATLSITHDTPAGIPLIVLLP